MGPDHAPLSKRHGATSVKEFRDKGYLPEALVNYLALIGWSPGQNEELLPADELARRFRLENVAHSAGVFDEDKLAWANRHYLKVCDPDRLAALAEPHLRERGQIAGICPPTRARGSSACCLAWRSRSIDCRSWPIDWIPSSITNRLTRRSTRRSSKRSPRACRVDLD